MSKKKIGTALHILKTIMFKTYMESKFSILIVSKPTYRTIIYKFLKKLSMNLKVNFFKFGGFFFSQIIFKRMVTFAVLDMIFCFLTTKFVIEKISCIFHKLFKNKIFNLKYLLEISQFNYVNECKALIFNQIFLNMFINGIFMFQLFSNFIPIDILLNFEVSSFCLAQSTWQAT